MNDIDDQKEIDLLEIIKLIWSNRKRVIKWGFIAGCLGIIIALSIPKTYNSKIVIVPEVSEGNAGSGGSMGQLASFAGLNLGSNITGITEELYPLIIKSTPFVMEFANISVPYEGGQITLIDYFNEEQRSPWWSYILNAPLSAMSWVISLFKDDIEDSENLINLKELTQDQHDFIGKFNTVVLLSLDKKTGIINANCNTQSPEISMLIMDSISYKLQNYMYEYKTAKTRAELKSNKLMLTEARKNYYLADSLYAISADQNLRTYSNKSMILLDRLENEKELTFQIYKQLASQVELNKTKLNEEIPIMTILEPATLPIKASAPNKILIVIAFAFLGGIISVLLLIIKEKIIS